MRFLTGWVIEAGLLLLYLYVPILVAGMGVLVWRLRRGVDDAVGRTVRDIAVALALALIMVVTLLVRSPGLGPDEPVRVKWLPFSDLIDALRGEGRLRLTITEMIGNVFLFMPLGLALRWRNPALSVGQVAMIAALVSIGVEVTQGLLLTDRWPTTTDVIMNAAGGLIGGAMAGSVVGGLGVDRRT